MDIKLSCEHWRPDYKKFEGCPVTIEGPEEIEKNCLFCSFNPMDKSVTESIVAQKASTSGIGSCGRASGA